MRTLDFGLYDILIHEINNGKEWEKIFREGKHLFVEKKFCIFCIYGIFCIICIFCIFCSFLELREAISGFLRM